MLAIDVDQRLSREVARLEEALRVALESDRAALGRLTARIERLEAVASDAVLTATRLAEQLEAAKRELTTLTQATGADLEALRRELHTFTVATGGLIAGAREELREELRERIEAVGGRA
jgi:hypothetical protein